MRTATVQKKDFPHKDYQKMMGSVLDDGDSVKQIRELRWKLSKEIHSWDDVQRMQAKYIKKYGLQ